MEGLLCQGRAITLKSDASDPAGRQLSYRWRLNGQPAGTNAPTFSFTPDAAGNYTVQVEVVDSTDASRVASAGPVTLNVREYRVPTATCSAQPTSLKAGDTSNLSATGTASACSSIASYKWSVTEGSVSNPTSPTTTFNSKGVTFQPTARIQTKSVTATATVADDRGATATCTASVQVQFTPTMARFGDIIFAKNGSRVNNCGKRILLEEVAAKAADPDYEIILIGHIDQDEAKRRPVRGRTLDQDRAFNAAAVLTGGTGTCGKIDLSRVRVDWVGTEQTADFQPGLCGTAARAATEERSGSQVTSADQNRRVEVWLVPRGTPMPPSVKGLKVLPEDVMKKLGCPK